MTITLTPFALRSLSIFLFCVLCAASSVAQTVPLTGRIIDHATGMAVERAVVTLRETGTHVSTDSGGVFRLTVPAPGMYTVSVRHVAYAATERVLRLPSAAAPGVSADAVARPEQIVIALHPVLLPSGEVIIHSTRSSAAARNTPFPVELVRSDDPSLHAAVTVPDAVRNTPGASIVRDGPWETAVSIRGMSRSNIIMLVDDTRIETANDIAGALSLVDMQDIDRIEIVRSPGSALYGSGALGGVIHMVTKRPSFSPDGHTDIEVTEGVTSVDRGAAHHLSVDNASEIHSLRLSGGFRKAGDTRTPAGVLPGSHYQDFTLAGTLGVRTFGTQSLFVSYQRVQAEDTGIPGGAPIAASASARYLLARRELISLEYAVPNISSAIPLLTAKLSRQSIDRNVEIVQNPSLTLTPHATHDVSSVQLESKLALMPDAVLTLGAEAWRRDLDSRRERTINPSGDVIGERPVPSSTYVSGGVYAHNEWQLAPAHLTLALGARYDWIRVSNEDGYNPDYVIFSGMRDIRPPDRVLLWKKNTVHDDSWSANAGAVYAIAPILNISCLAAAAYRAPSLEERFQYIDLGSIVRVGDPALRPEQSLSLNAGIDLRSDAVSARADVFFNHLTDLVAEIPGVFEGRSALVKTNIGEGRLYGFELSGAYSPALWTVLTSSLSFVRGEDTRTHANLPQIAPMNGRTSAAFIIPAAGRAEVSVSYAWTQSLTAAGELRTPGYATLDADLSSEPLRLGAASFTFHGGVRNLFDAAYRNHLSTLRGLIRLEPGRNLYFSVTAGV